MCQLSWFSPLTLGKNLNSTNRHDLKPILEIFIKEVAANFGVGFFSVDFDDFKDKVNSRANNFENYAKLANPGIEIQCKLAFNEIDKVARVQIFKVISTANLDLADEDFAIANANKFLEHRKVIEDLIDNPNKSNNFEAIRKDWAAIDALKKCLESRDELKFEINFGGERQESLVTFLPSSFKINLETEKTVTGSIRYFDKKSQNLVIYKTDQSQGELQLHVNNFEDCQTIRKADANDSILTVTYYATVDAARPSLNLHRGDLKEIIKIWPGQSSF